MENKMSETAKKVYMVLNRFHQSQRALRGDGGLPNVEFFILSGIAMMLDAKSGKKCCVQVLPKADVSEEVGITLGEIIKVTGMSMSAASKKISILEKKGLVQRNHSKTDRRNVYITLTKKGREICESDRAEKHAIIEEIIRRMGEEDMDRLLTLANSVFDIVNEIADEQRKIRGGEGFEK
ncbi:MAG: MarR family transcriptional regulator [Lachnospiraceae bacterium]|nr:MarR family transcriptional regulator [Lachnospiraceae bacterium]